jgi:two-component system sensor histidine kinase and response regulator WspE
MPDYDSMSLNEIFKLDAAERLQVLNRLILAIEKEPGKPLLFEDAMREAHSLKAAARIVNNSEVQNIAHGIEELLEIFKKGERAFISESVDLLLECLDGIRDMVHAFVDGRSHQVDAAGMVLRLAAAGKGESPLQGKVRVPEKQVSETQGPPARRDHEEAPEKRSPEGGNSAKRKAVTEKIMVGRESADPTIRIGIERLNKLMNLSGEIYTSMLQFKRQHQNLKGILKDAEAWSNSLRSLRRLMLEERLESARFEAWFTKAEEELQRFDRMMGPYEEAVDLFSVNFERLGSELQSDIMRSRMISVAALFESQARFVRDLARESGKRINLRCEGGETEVDKSILEILKDPLTHLIRNSCDHGLERPEARRAAGKNEEGEIVLKAYYRADRVLIIVEDDGQGIDPERVKKCAVEKRFLDEEKAGGLEREELFELLFMPGFSTAREITPISGRGVGLDIVRANLSKVGGRIQIESAKGQFTRFILSLPLTLAVTKTLLVEAGGEIACIPVTRVEEVLNISRDEIKTAEGRDMIAVRGEIIPAVFLSGLWQFEKKPIKETQNPVVIIGQGKEKVALLVERLLDEKEVVGKNLDHRLGVLQDISGATILENGEVAFIVDPDSLLRSCGEYTGKSVSAVIDAGAQFKRKKILVVEDSLTVRELEKKVLENYGYEVLAAVDGLDGFNKAREFKPDLVVTDIEMPHINGFELISLLKKDKALAEVPTIIVSFREREEDKRRGMEVGADLYMTKSQYDNKTLLEAIARLIGA